MTSVVMGTSTTIRCALAPGGAYATRAGSVLRGRRAADDGVAPVLVCGMVGMYPVGGVAFDYLQYVVGLEQSDTRFSTTRTPGRGRTILCDAPGPTTPHTRRDFWATSSLVTCTALRHGGTTNTCATTTWGWVRTSSVAGYEAQMLCSTSVAQRRCRKDCHLPAGRSSSTPTPGTTRSCSASTSRGHRISTAGVRSWIATRTTPRTRRTCRRASLLSRISGCRGGRRMPVVLDLWQRLAVGRSKTWTTIMTWNAFPGPLRYRGHEMAARTSSFSGSSMCQGTLPAARGRSRRDDSARSRAATARVARGDAPTVTRTAGDYVDYLCRSRGEFSVAKNVYVEMKTGWFSCRSACPTWLAGDRPWCRTPASRRSLTLTQVC